MADGSALPVRASRHLILCLDGTWSSGFEEHKRHRDDHTVLKPTNPLKLARAVVPFDREAKRWQFVYYDIGVGALAEYPGRANEVLRTADRWLGGAWGAGFEGNVEDALNFLVLNLVPGDAVFVFGFSRGAATARAVTEFLEWNGGLPVKDDAYFLPRLFRAYVQTHGAAGARDAEVERINAELRYDGRAPLANFQRVEVAYLGVWDTVLALGSRFAATETSTTGPARSFYTGTMPAACVAHARQALAIDEHRYDFRPEIWTHCHPGQEMAQRWFAGVHSNVGGGYTRDGLANVALHWIVEGAVAAGLTIQETFLDRYPPKACGSLYDSDTRLYQVLDAVREAGDGGRRSLLGHPPDAWLDLHPSVIERMRCTAHALEDGAEPDAITTLYRPENVLAFLAAQPDVDGYLERIEAGLLPEDVRRVIEARRQARQP
jgi:uncharacterized protein (DUF2235 family)